MPVLKDKAVVFTLNPTRACDVSFVSPKPKKCSAASKPEPPLHCEIDLDLGSPLSPIRKADKGESRQCSGSKQKAREAEAAEAFDWRAPAPKLERATELGGVYELSGGK